MLKVKVKATKKEARELLGMKNEFKAGGKKMMGENPESRQPEDSNRGYTPGNDLGEASIALPAVEQANGFPVVKPVASQVPDGYPEQARRKNNASRDMRCLLGRQKASNIVTE